jgi:hypothetical protein
MEPLWPRLDRLDERVLHHILAIDDHAHHARTGAKQFSPPCNQKRLELSLKQADAILPLCLAQHSIVADNGRAANDGQLGTTLACAALEGLESPNCVSAIGPSSAEPQRR